MKPLALLCLLLPYAALAGESTRQPYACDNGSRLDISFSAENSGRPQATLHFADSDLVLPAVPAASGALYRNGDIKLHTKGEDAVFEDGKANIVRCRQGDTPPAGRQAVPQPVASSFVDLSGSVSYLARSALPPDAILSIRIHAGQRTLAEQRYELNGAQPPIPFSATLDRDLIGKAGKITVSARIEQRGKARLAGQASYPLPTNGQAAPVELTLKPTQRR